MTNLLILGAGGNIAGHVIDMLSAESDVHLTLFVRKANRLNPAAMPPLRLVHIYEA